MVRKRSVAPASRRRATMAAAMCLAAACTNAARADTLDQTGVRQLWMYEPDLTGSGISVAQAEATDFDRSDPNNPIDLNDFEVNPVQAAGSPIFVYINSTGAITTSFPNHIGTESAHADTVAQYFYGNLGPAPGVADVLNYNANYFTSNVIDSYVQVQATVVNQSFIIDQSTTPAVDIQEYDNYVDLYNTVIVTAGGNGGPIQEPGTAYNVITVSAWGANVSVGTSDGRSKPDITAPSSATSFSTPQVSGIAAILDQAGREVTGYSSESDATDARTIKALLLNGASKTPGWTHTDAMPLDPVNGAGVVNANASVRLLNAGEFKPVSSGGTQLPSTGWNLQTITSSANADAVDTYPLNLQTVTGKAFFTATLVWNRPIHDTSDGTVGGINNLDLLLVNTATDATVAESISTVDNVEQIYLPVITPGTYDLEVLKHMGSAGNPNWVSDAETYSLAWSTNLVADANMDGTVNNADLVTLLTHFGESGATLPMGDFNGDGTINNADLVALLTNYGTSMGNQTQAQPSGAFHLAAATAPVPEPASLSLLALGSVLLVRRRR